MSKAVSKTRTPTASVTLEGSTADNFNAVKSRLVESAPWHKPTSGDVLRFALAESAKVINEGGQK